MKVGSIFGYVVKERPLRGAGTGIDIRSRRWAERGKIY